MERVGKACVVARRSNAETKEECACGVPAARVLNGVLGESPVELRDLGHALFDYSGNVFVCTARRMGGEREGRERRGGECPPTSSSFLLQNRSRSPLEAE